MKNHFNFKSFIGYAFGELYVKVKTEDRNKTVAIFLGTGAVDDAKDYMKRKNAHNKNNIPSA